MSSEFFAGPLAQAVGWSLLHLVWEATIVAAILAATLALMTRRSANARYLVSCAALALLPVLAVMTAYRSYEAPLQVSTAAVPAAHFEVTPASPSDGPAFHLIAPATDEFTLRTIAASARDYLPQIVLLWLLGVTFFSIRLVVSWTRVQRLAKASATPASNSWQRAASRLAEALRLRRAIQLIESAAVEVPTVIGWLRPMILLPASTLSGLTTEQIEMVLAHELAHIRRNDFFVNLLQTVVETLMFYHPAVWWISRSVRIEREHCCDDLAIAVCGNPLQYARALTRLEELRAAQNELAVAANGGSLLMRIRRLVVSQKESTGVGARWTAGAAVLAVIILAVTLPTLPALAKHDAAPAKSALEVTDTRKTETKEKAETKKEDTETNTDVEVDVDDSMTIEQPAAPEATPAPAVAAAPATAPAPPVVAVSTTPYAAMAPMAVAVTAVTPAVRVTVAPEAISAAIAEAMSDERTPRPARVRVRGRDQDFSGSNGKLSVDELIALRNAGVTPEYINDMRTNSGFSELSLKDIYEMRMQGVTPKYLKDLRNSGIAIKTPHEATELRIQGVSPEYIAQIASAGYKNVTTRDLIELRAMGVTGEYIGQLAAAGYKNLSVRDLVHLRSMGVSPAFIKALADAGYSNLSAEDLTRLAASGVNADFIRDMAKYRINK